MNYALRGRLTLARPSCGPPKRRTTQDHSNVTLGNRIKAKLLIALYIGGLLRTEIGKLK